MNGDERDRFIRGWFEECRALAVRKGEEYKTEDGDVNGNMKRVAAETDVDVFRVWNTYFQKHLDSLRNWIKDPGHPQTESIQSRLMDMTNYLAIMASMIEETEKEEAELREEV